MDMLRFPLKTNEVTEVIFDKLSRIFDGRNPSNNYQFMNAQMRDDWEYYRQERLNEPQVWQVKGWEFFKTQINSILVVDMPIEQTEGLPEPYFYWLKIERLIDYGIKDEFEGTLRYIIFHDGHNRIAVIDDEYYRVYATKDGTTEIVGEPLVESAHGLGYCPARFFCNQPLSLQHTFLKWSPISKVLTALDWYLFFYTSKHILDLYANYPVYWGYQQECNYADTKGHFCDGGFIRDLDGYIYDSTGQLMRCPKCGGGKIAGVGSFIEVTPPKSKDDPDLRNPVGKLDADISAVNYNVEEEQRIRNEIILSCVGSDGRVLEKEAVNETQVVSNFESQSTILNRVKKIFESAQEFVDETVCRLRYGKGFVSLNINMGTEFYTLTPEKLREQYLLAKTAGASEAELDALNQRILETEYRTNPILLQRMLILSQLEPYRHLTRDEVVALADKGLITQQDLLVKLNFVSFVERFERENTNIIEFGTARKFDDKIKIIAETLKEYANGSNKTE